MPAATQPPQEFAMYKRILVPLDGSDTAQLGLAEAIGIAQPLKARLLLLQVVDDLAWLVEMSAVANSAQLHREVRHYAEEVLAKAKAAATAKDVEADSIVRETVGGRPADAIVDEACKQGCDLIVMGTHGRKGLSRMVLGSDAAAVVQASSVPVLLVRSVRARA
jgi:nucleotide-binding universal stress UspA family protein